MNKFMALRKSILIKPDLGQKVTIVTKFSLENHTNQFIVWH